MQNCDNLSNNVNSENHQFKQLQRKFSQISYFRVWGYKFQGLGNSNFRVWGFQIMGFGDFRGFYIDFGHNCMHFQAFITEAYSFLGI